MNIHPRDLTARLTAAISAIELLEYTYSEIESNTTEEPHDLSIESSERCASIAADLKGMRDDVPNIFPR